MANSLSIAQVDQYEREGYVSPVRVLDDEDVSYYRSRYDGFERNKVHGWVMQQAGAFTVDREGQDRRAIKQAVATLAEGRYALTVFPEGNVYLTNDRVTPFLEGAAFIGMKAQKNLGDQPVYAVPVSIKATYTDRPYSHIMKRVRCLAQEAGTDLNRNGDSVSTLKRIGLEILKKTLEEQGHPLPKNNDSHLPSYLRQAAEAIIVGLEKALEVRQELKSPLIDRIRKVRRMVHAVLTDVDKRATHPYAAYWAEEAMFALRILSYPGEYLDENPTVDRYAETVEKLTEDLYGELQPPCSNRHAFVYCNEPVALAEYLDEYRSNARETLNTLTRRFEQAVQDGVDKLNRANPYPGGKAFAGSLAALVH